MDSVGASNKFGSRKDYLNFAKRENIASDLERLQEKPLTQDIFTDSVFIYDNNFKKRRSAIVITNEKIYLYDLSKWRLLFRTEITDLKGVSITTKNCTLSCLHFQIKGKDIDIIVESYRRIEVIVYIAKVMKDNKIPLFKLKMRENLSFQQVASKVESSSSEVQNLEKVQKGFEAPYLSETIRNAKKTGFMRLAKKGGFFGGVSLEEYYFLLSDMGLVYSGKTNSFRFPMILKIIRCPKNSKEKTNY
jgi:hypothetical protein